MTDFKRHESKRQRQKTHHEIHDKIATHIYQFWGRNGSQNGAQMSDGWFFGRVRARLGDMMAPKSSPEPSRRPKTQENT